MRHDKAVVDSYGAVVRGEGLLGAAELGERVAAACVRQRAAGVDLCGAAVRGQGVGVAADLG